MVEEKLEVIDAVLLIWLNPLSVPFDVPAAIHLLQRLRDYRSFLDQASKRLKLIKICAHHNAQSTHIDWYKGDPKK